MPIASAGIGSGLDVNGLVGQLMALESRPLTTLATREAKYQAQLTAYGSLKGALSSFQSNVAALASPARYSTVNASVADAAVATASAGANAAPGTHTLEIQALAQAQKLASAAFPSATDEIGSGTLTIQFGTYAGGNFALNPDKAVKAIVIGSGNSSLAGVRDAINAAAAGVTASIINDGSGNRLVLASNDTGLANALRITVADDDLSNTDQSGLSLLAYNAVTGGIANLTQTAAPGNAALVIDGITIIKASNTVDDALEGITLNLLKVSTPGTTAINVSRDNSSVQSAVQSFVKAYNDLNKTVIDLSKYDAATKRASTLTGEATLRSVQAQMRGAFNNALSSDEGGFSTLADIGITFQKDGTLKLDANRLNTVLADPGRNIASLFAVVGKPTDSLVSYAGSTEDTRNGTYLLNVSQVATRGRAVGGGPAALIISAGINDTLDMTVDGVAASLTLDAGTYTADALGAAIQSKLNGAAALTEAGITVSVTHDTGVLNVTSSRYGSASSAAVTGGNAKPDLFGTPLETSGVDVAGTIGGTAAVGSGRTLTGSADANGLALLIQGGAAGFRGSVTLTRGYAYTLEKLAARMLDNDSLLDGRIDGINASIKDINAQRDALSRRLEVTEKRYRAQFSALDSMIASMSKTSDFLQQQLANLPKSS